MGFMEFNNISGARRREFFGRFGAKGKEILYKLTTLPTRRAGELFALSMQNTKGILWKQRFPRREALGICGPFEQNTKGIL